MAKPNALHGETGGTVEELPPLCKQVALVQILKINQLINRVQDHKTAKGRGKGKMSGRLR